MKAAIFHGGGRPLDICDVQVDNPEPHEILVRVAASGLCHSDYHFMTGALPFDAPGILGHEAAGVVERTGTDVTSVSVGDRVVSCVTAFCGRCNLCASGRGHLCDHRPGRAPGARPRLSHRGTPLAQAGQLGAFAEQMLVHENSVVRINPAIPLDRAALLGCGVLTGVGAVINSAKVKPGSTVAVLGCGGVGLNVIQGARLSGASQIIAIDARPEKLETARRFGATQAILGDDDIASKVREATNGGVDHAFEVVGLPATLEQCAQMLGRGGTLTMVGAMRHDASFSTAGLAMLMNESRIEASFMGSGPFTRDIPRLGELYLCGRLDLDGLIAERIDLQEINRGFETMLHGGQARSVIVFPGVSDHAEFADASMSRSAGQPRPFTTLCRSNHEARG